MDAYIKRDHVMQALTYVGTAEPTDIIPLTLAAARKAIMRLPTAELEQLAEIERLKAENEKLTINMNAYGLTAKRLKEDVDRLQDINNRDVENLRLAKAEVAREIFEEIEYHFDQKISFYQDMRFRSFSIGKDEEVKYANTMIANLTIYKKDIAELKKKYTGENADGL